MFNSNYQSSTSTSSSSSLKRSISTPGTLFAFRNLNLDNDMIDSGNKFVPNGRNSYGGGSSFKLLNKISPEELAKQLTLLDWSIFSLITRNELKPGQWTGPKKYNKSPNVVAFTRRFNNLTNWISDEILSVKQPKQRADVIIYFIKVASYLIEIKNLYSSYAIFCALTSEPIHRLDKTWANVGKKERILYDKIEDLFSQSENSIKLRNFMDESINSPNGACIPLLSTFLRDIIHIDSCYASNDSDKMGERIKKLETIYTFIEKCQQSNYDFIDLVEIVYDYLNSFNYIEELQKFREDDYYKISLSLEPLEASASQKTNKVKLYQNRFNSTYDIRSTFYTNECASTLDIRNSRALLNKSLNDELFFQTKYQQPKESTPFKPGHRKTNSLEAGPIAILLNNKSNSLTTRRNIKLNLIDDSPSYDHTSSVGNHGLDSRKPILEVKFKKPPSNYLDTSSFSNEEDGSSLDDQNDASSRNLKQNFSTADLLFSSMVGRKTVLKGGKKQSISFWFNYFMGITNDSLLFFNSKSFGQPNLSKPIKSLSLSQWSVSYIEETNYSEKKNVFTIADHSCMNVYKIRTATEKEAKEWVQVIHKVMNNLKSMYIL